MAKTKADSDMILEAVLIAARDAAQAIGTPKDAIARAELMAYHDVLSVAQETADQLGLTMADLGVGDFDADTLLKSLPVSESA